MRRLTPPVKIRGRCLQVDARIGIAVAEADTNGPFELLRRAETAKYAVRANGKGGSQAYGSSLEEGRILRRQIERGIASGLGRNEFDVVHPPLVDAQDFTTVGVEALVRSPGRPAGPVQPSGLRATG
ncbi:MAG: hypothetical protein GC196_10845 [Hyphomonas sp.]|nr:hypothetical protein [Hyphomonas sp.]